MPVMEIPVSCFSLEHTMLSGQPPYFLMNYNNGRAEFLVGSAAVFLEQIQNSLRLEWSGESDEEVRKVVEYRFRLKDDMKLIYKKIIKDEFMLNAVRELYGLRLTLSEPWETLACFICSTNNNLKNIKCIVENLSCMFGEKVTVDGRVFHRFPTADVISKADLKMLKKCKLGFRAAYLKNAAKVCLEKVDLTGIAEMSYAEGRMELMRIKGVGEKIADCVMLFAYGKLEAFPIDVWVRRTMQRVYFKERKPTDSQIRSFAMEYWDGYAGYAQQYVYQYGRKTTF